MKKIILTLIVTFLSISTFAYADNESTFNRDSAYEAFSKREEVKSKDIQVEVEQKINNLYEQHKGNARHLMSKIFDSSIVVSADSAGRIWTLMGDVDLRNGSSSEELVFYIEVKLASGVTGHHRRFITYDKDRDEYKQTDHVWFTPVEATDVTIFIYICIALFSGAFIGKAFL